MNFIIDVLPKGVLPVYEHTKGDNYTFIGVKYNRKGDIIAQELRSGCWKKEHIEFFDYYIQESNKVTKKEILSKKLTLEIYNFNYETFGLGTITGSTLEEWEIKRNKLIESVKEHPLYNNQDLLNVVFIQRTKDLNFYHSEEAFLFEV